MPVAEKVRNRGNANHRPPRNRRRAHEAALHARRPPIPRKPTPHGGASLPRIAPKPNKKRAPRHISAKPAVIAIRAVQPFTEPATRPETIRFWQSTKKMKIGTSAITVVAMKLGQSVVNCPTAL